MNGSACSSNRARSSSSRISTSSSASSIVSSRVSSSAASGACSRSRQVVGSSSAGSSASGCSCTAGRTSSWEAISACSSAPSAAERRGLGRGGHGHGSSWANAIRPRRCGQQVRRRMASSFTCATPVLGWNRCRARPIPDPRPVARADGVRAARGERRAARLEEPDEPRARALRARRRPLRAPAPAHARDTDLMVDGAAPRSAPDRAADGRGPRIVTPAPLRAAPTIDCGLAGTLMRFLPPVAALADGAVRVRRRRAAPAPARWRRRCCPSARSASTVDDDGRGTLPFTVARHGRGRAAARCPSTRRRRASSSPACCSPAPASTTGSTWSTAAPRLPSPAAHRHDDRRAPQRRVRWTRSSSARAGGRVAGPSRRTASAGATSRSSPTSRTPRRSSPRRWSPAAASTVAGWPEATTQVGDRLRDLLGRLRRRRSSCDRRRADRRRRRARRRPLRPVDLDLAEGGELAPTLVGLAALADGTATFTGIGAPARPRDRPPRRARRRADGALGAHVDARPTTASSSSRGPPRARAAVARATPTTGSRRPAPCSGSRSHGLEVDDIGTTAKTLPGLPRPVGADARHELADGRRGRAARTGTTTSPTRGSGPNPQAAPGRAPSSGPRTRTPCPAACSPSTAAACRSCSTRTRPRSASCRRPGPASSARRASSSATASTSSATPPARTARSPASSAIEHRAHGAAPQRRRHRRGRAGHRRERRPAAHRRRGRQPRAAAALIDRYLVAAFDAGHRRRAARHEDRPRRPGAAPRGVRAARPARRHDAGAART